jgi:hypothetical protein
LQRKAKGEEQRAKRKEQSLCPLLFNVSLFVEPQIKLPLTTLKTYDNHQSPF